MSCGATLRAGLPAISHLRGHESALFSICLKKRHGVAVWIAIAPDFKFDSIKDVKDQKVVTGLMPTTSTALGAKRRLLSFQPQVVAPQLFALNATYRAIRNGFPGRTIFDYMDRKPSAQVAENAKFYNRLASRPKLSLPQAVSRQICAANSNGVFQEAHRQFKDERLPPQARLLAAPDAPRHRKHKRPRSRRGRRSVRRQRRGRAG